MGKKSIPRAVLEERLRVLEAGRLKRKRWLIRFGVYAAVVIGVLGSQAIIVRDDLTTVLTPIKLGQLLGALLVSLFVYAKTEESRIRAKHLDVGRILITAFYNGFFWMTIVGVWGG